MLLPWTILRTLRPRSHTSIWFAMLCCGSCDNCDEHRISLTRKSSWNVHFKCHRDRSCCIPECKAWIRFVFRTLLFCCHDVQQAPVIWPLAYHIYFHNIVTNAVPPIFFLAPNSKRWHNILWFNSGWSGRNCLPTDWYIHCHSISSIME